MSNEQIDLNANTGDTLYNIRSGFMTRSTGIAGTHSHTITIQNKGKGIKHENRMPYESVIRWYRTA